MKKENIPDNVVYNEATKKYDASLKPYATNVGAPKIVATNNITWKNKNINKANKQIKAKYLELKAEYDDMLKVLEYNNLVYNAKFNFEPLIGQTYHLYRDKNKNPFLSIIAPAECHFDFIGSFYLNSEQIWQKTNEDNSTLPQLS